MTAAAHHFTETLLRWHRDAGVDELLAMTPCDAYTHVQARNAATRQPSPPQPMAEQTGNIHEQNVSQRMTEADTKPAASPTRAPTPSAAAMHGPAHHRQEAARLAAQCDTLDALYEAINSFDGCALKRTASNTVIYDGVTTSNVMIIGEAPGREEDIQGIPFCGPSGQLLDKMLAAIGLSRSENCYITNVLFWRPPGNRKPNPEELAMLAPFVNRHIHLFAPALILVMGGTAAGSLLQETRGITRIRGRLYHYETEQEATPIPVIPTYHPSYLLRQPGHKRLAWQDLLAAKKIIEDVNAT